MSTLRPLFWLTVCLLLACQSNLYAFQNPASAPPNVLIIVGDDMGYGDVGFHGCKDIPTPHMDALAASGVRFTNGYVSGPYCSPTRAALLTGRYQQRFGHEFNPSGNAEGLPLSESTLADRLGSAGYKTALVGKWHLGNTPDRRPMRRGFQEFFGFLGGAHSYFESEGIFRGNEPAGDIDYTTDRFGKEAVDFIETNRKEPWFLYLAFNAVHTPMHATEARLEKFSAIKDPQRRKYAAMMSAMDDAIGSVRQALKATEQESRTLIAFISDNGGPTMQGVTVNGSDNTPLRGSKRTTLEGGVRVPFVLSWPGVIKPGVYHEPVIQIDLHATALAACQVPLKADWKLDGVDLMPYVTGQKSTPPHEALYWRFGPQMAIRKGDWKLVQYDKTADGQSAGGGPRARVTAAKLYDLSKDIHEDNDLSGQMPQKVRELKADWDLWNSLNIAPLWGAGQGQQGAVNKGGPKRAKARPNIVLLYADDLGYGDVRCNNLERCKIDTPNIDRLAKQGMRFTDAHSSSGCCSPSRYALMTGRYHWRTTLQSGIVGVWGKPLIAENRLTIGKLVQQAGYRTACFGKWHLGHDWPIEEADKKYFQGFGGKPGGGGAVHSEYTAEHVQVWHKVFSQTIEGGPIDRGFDEYFGTDVPNWPPYCFIEADRTVGIPSQLLPAEKLVKNQASLQGPALENWHLEKVLPALVRRSVEFIERQAAADQPFFLYLPFTSPHTPLAVNEAWRGKSGLQSDFADLVMETDSAVGEILDALDRAGISDETLVVFTSDNGCASYIGVKQLEQQGHFPSGVLRGYKSDAWEGGHRVPFIVRWPGIVAPGSVCEHLVHQADWIRTVSEILELPLPEDAGEDSFSLLPLLEGQQTPVREHAVSTSCSGTPALRVGNWKWIPPVKAEQTGELYNLEEDLSEKRNLVTEKPEQVEQMKQLLESLILKGRSTLGSNQKNDVRVTRYPKTSS
jgi:arylsulfatase A-like enzyme